MDLCVCVLARKVQRHKKANMFIDFSLSLSLSLCKRMCTHTTLISDLVRGWGLGFSSTLISDLFRVCGLGFSSTLMIDLFRD